MERPAYVKARSSLRANLPNEVSYNQIMSTFNGDYWTYDSHQGWLTWLAVWPYQASFRYRHPKRWTNGLSS